MAPSNARERAASSETADTLTPLVACVVTAAVSEAGVLALDAIKQSTPCPAVQPLSLTLSLSGASLPAKTVPCLPSGFQSRLSPPNLLRSNAAHWHCHPLLPLPLPHTHCTLTTFNFLKYSLSCLRCCDSISVSKALLLACRAALTCLRFCDSLSVSKALLVACRATPASQLCSNSVRDTFTFLGLPAANFDLLRKTWPHLHFNFLICRAMPQLGHCFGTKKEGIAT